MLFCEFCDIFQSSFLIEHLRTVASGTASTALTKTTPRKIFSCNFPKHSEQLFRRTMLIGCFCKQIATSLCVYPKRYTSCKINITKNRKVAICHMKVLDSDKFNLKVNLMIKVKNSTSELVRVLLTEAYLGSCPTSMMELFCKNS